MATFPFRTLCEPSSAFRTTFSTSPVCLNSGEFDLSGSKAPFFDSSSFNCYFEDLLASFSAAKIISYVRGWLMRTIKSFMNSWLNLSSCRNRCTQTFYSRPGSAAKYRFLKLF